MAVKAARLHSGPGATAWILVCERACSVTFRAWDASRDKGHMSFFCEGREDRSWCSKQDAQSHTHRAHPHTYSVEDKTLTALVQWCATARVQPPFRWHGCCERSEGEHHSHRTEPQEEQSGRCRRRCTCSRTAGKGSDVQEVCVQGRVFAVTANVASQSRLQSGPRQLFWQGAFRFLCSFSCVLLESAHSGYVAPCRNRLALFDF